MTKPNKGKVCPQIETHPPIRLDEVPGLTPAQRADSRARLQRGETFHIVDPITRQARRVTL